MTAIPSWLYEWAKSRKSTKRGNIKSPEKPPLFSGAPPPHILARARFRALAGGDIELERKHELEGFLKALAIIPANLPYEEWFEVGAGIYDYDPTATGLLIFKSWAWQSERHRTDADQMACEKKWVEYQKGENKEGRITKASIYFRASEIERLEAMPKATGQAIPANTTSTVTNSINGVPFALPAALAQGSPIRFPDLDRAGRPKPTCANARVAIQRFGLCCRYDTFHQKYDVAGQHIGQWSGDISDDMVHVLRIITLDRFGFDPGSQHAFDAAVQECLQHAYDPILDYLDSLKWDGRPRLAMWLPDYLGADPTPFNKAVGELSLTAAVRRARHPGCKFDHVIMLEGLENIGKSSTVEILAGQENFSDQEILTLDDRRQQEALQGVWLYELAELSGLHRADSERVKAFITRRVDRTRPAYGRKRIDRPRRCIFFGTSNPPQYLLSHTGNRRFWPVKCRAAKLAQLQETRDQLWAEANTLEAKNRSLILPESIWPEAMELQDSRRISDPWEEKLHGIEHNKLTQALWGEYRITTLSILEQILRIPEGQQTQVHSKRLGEVMRNLGWDGPKVVRLKLVENSDETFTSKGYVKSVTGSVTGL